MKKQKPNTPFKALFPLICLISFFLQRVFLCSALLLVLTVTISRAQNLIEGSLQKVTYLEDKPQIFKIPANTSAKYLFLRTEGADGGKRYNDELNIDYAKGGEGATMKAWFPIGTGANQVPPGSDICILVGHQGASQATIHTIGGGGGGGTGVLFRKPDAGKWNLLMVAGGGGGAVSGFQGDQDGDPGNTATNGSKNGGDNGEGGARGDGESSEAGYGGGGIYSKGGGDYGGAPGWSTDPSDDPVGGAGGGHDQYVDVYIISGGWGFGGGGSGRKSGGGGGGYSGGGGGHYASNSFSDNKGYAGGGGGSYINGSFAVSGSILKIKNGSTTSPGSGFVEYQLTRVLPDHSIKLAADAQKCIDVETPEFNNRDNIRLWDCASYAKTQSWKFDGLQIKLFYDDKKCMDVKDHQTANGTNVRIWDCMNHNEQKWVYDGLTKQLRSLLDLNKCLNDAYGGRTDNGTNIMLWDCKSQGGAGDQWILEGAVAISDPTAIHYIVPIKASGLALQSASGAQWGSNVQLGTKNTNDSSERWVFDGMYIKYSPSRDLCLTLKDSNTDIGTNIELRGCSDSDAKKWVYNGLTQQFHSALDPDKCLEVATSGVYEKGMNIQIMDCNQHSRQKFNVL